MQVMLLQVSRLARCKAAASLLPVEDEVRRRGEAGGDRAS